MNQQEFDEIIRRLKDARRTTRPPSWEEQLRYGFTHGPNDDRCRLCGKENCRCWRDE